MANELEVADDAVDTGMVGIVMVASGNSRGIPSDMDVVGVTGTVKV